VRVGILGGGQLGCMLADSLHALGASVAFYEPAASAPAHRRFADATCAPFEDRDALSAFFARCDAVTYESENVPTAPIASLPPGALDKLRPGLHVLRVVQDRVEEKAFFARSGLPSAATRALTTIAELPGVASEIGFPFILKTAQGGYDGKGQWRIDGLADLGSLPPLRARAPGRFVVEEVVDLAGECSVIVARAIREGAEHIEVFPVFENLHHKHILDLTLLPAGLTSRQQALATALAVRAARELDATGLLTVEFFLARTPGRGAPAEADGLHLRLNELAPRPHNSGHVTRRACSLSQFDQLARMLVGLPPAPVHTHPGGWAMAQLLGHVWGDRPALDLGPWAAHPAVVELMDYGKTSAHPDRKMGHLIAAGDSARAAADAALALRAALSQG
jgi:5-(carboxyamino)imidazole ribonucleotide synthase